MIEHHTAQKQVIRESRRFNVLACARRWGKTTLGIDRVTIPALEGYPTVWFSPTYKSLGESWRELIRVLEPVIVRKNETSHRLELVSGGVIEMWSLDEQNAARGRKYKIAVIDEAAIVRNLEQAWTLAIRPTLTDFKGGAWFMSSPRGSNYFKTLYDKGQDPLDTDWASWKMPTISNPYMDPQEVEDARRDLHELAFQQEYLAEFVSFEGAVFRNLDACATALPQDGPKFEHEYVIAIDWGRSKDYTVAIVLDASTREAVHLERWGMVEYHVQRQRIRTMVDKWKPALILAESNSIGTPNIEQLQREGIPVRPFLTTNTSKTLAIEGLTLAFEREDLHVIPDPVLMGELYAFAAEKMPSGLMKYSAPEGQHDDTVMALAIAWTAIESYQPQDEILTYEDRVHISEY